MTLQKIAGDCHDRDCPTVYVSDRGTVVFQGDAVTEAGGLRLGDGEQAVELPMSVVREAISALGT
ncbi:hypothetical protein GPZ80_16715 [Actinokineospora sp. HBU206404]|uniref:Uncharacterized protein n=2 Tax=Actinokineospora xionganensis TaxID=2684470 RepID=A0ABR7L802_9PSEU|nr:hypothetical protein [Actinokineospora xionganensis]